MDALITRQAKALKLIEQIVDLEPDQGTLAYALKMRERLKLPMSIVLDKLWPDMNVTDKVDKLGVTRQTYYGWTNGLFRPDAKMAKKLAALTGFDVDEIRGQRALRRR